MHLLANDLLAQTQVEQSNRKHTCSTAMDRNKNTVDDFLTIVDGSNMYTDVNFPTDDALFWKDAGEEGRDMDMLDESITWKRVSDDDFPKESFWGPKGKASINPQDIN